MPFIKIRRHFEKRLASTKAGEMWSAIQPTSEEAGGRGPKAGETMQRRHPDCKGHQVVHDGRQELRATNKRRQLIHDLQQET